MICKKFATFSQLYTYALKDYCTVSANIDGLYWSSPVNWTRKSRLTYMAADPISQIGWQTLRQPSCPRLPTCWQDPTRQTGVAGADTEQTSPCVLQPEAGWAGKLGPLRQHKIIPEAWGLNGWGLGVPTTCIIYGSASQWESGMAQNDGGSLPPAVTLSEVW